MKNKYLIIPIVLSVFAVTSCSFFTSSWGTGLKRDLSQSYEKKNTDQLAQMVTDPGVISDPEAGNQLLTALGTRDNLTDLSSKEQNNVLDLMVGASISADTITTVLDTITSASENSDPVEMISTIIDSMGTTDLAAVTKILDGLSDESKFGGDGFDVSSVAMASICVVAQVVKNDAVVENMDTVKDAFQGVLNATEENRQAAIDSAIESMNIQADAIDSVMAALNAVAVISKQEDAELFPGITIGQLMGGTVPPVNP